MVRDGELAVREQEVPGFPSARQRFVALRNPNLDLFTPREVSWIDRVLEQFKGLNGSEMSDASHETMGWRAARLHETIPYATVFVSDKAPTAYERQRSNELAREHGWLTA
jgi:hypothetical protein